MLNRQGTDIRLWPQKVDKCCIYLRVRAIATSEYSGNKLFGSHIMTLKTGESHLKARYQEN